MRIKDLTCLAMVAGIGLLAAGAQAVTRLEQQVLAELHRANRIEIAQSRLALERSASPAVRRMAQRLLFDHETADRELKAFSQRRGVPLEDMGGRDAVAVASERAHQRELDRLSRLSGAAFDAAYLGPEGLEHREVLALLNLARQRATDAEVIDLIDRNQGRLRAHALMAERLLTQIFLQTAR